MTKERPVIEGETVGIINKEGTVIWRLNPTAPSAVGHAGWITINAPAPSGELTLTRDREAVVSIWRRPEGGLGMPPTLGLTEAASTADDTSRYDSLAAVKIAAGPEPQMVIVNANGELNIQRRKKRFFAKVDGVAVPEKAIITEDGTVRILNNAGEIRFLIGISRSGSFIYSPVLDPYTAQGRVGIGVTQLNEAHAARLGGGSAATLVVNNVVGSTAAAKAGLNKLDLITSVDDKEATPTAFDHIVSQKQPGDRLRLGVVTQGQTRNVIVTLDRVDQGDFLIAVKGYQEVTQQLTDFGNKMNLLFEKKNNF